MSRDYECSMLFGAQLGVSETMKITRGMRRQIRRNRCRGPIVLRRDELREFPFYLGPGEYMLVFEGSAP